VEWSEEVFKIFRLDPATFTPQIDSIMNLSPWPEDHQRDEELIKKAMEHHEAGEYEQKFLRPDGSIGYYYSTFQGIYDDENSLVAIKGTVQDVTERKLAELALEASEKNLITAQKVAQLGHYVFDTTADAWTSSAELDSIFGIDDHFKRNAAGWLQIVHPEEREALSDYLFDHVLTKHQKFDREYRIIHLKSGEVKWVHGLGNLKFNHENKPVEMFGTIQNITERKLAEQALRHSEVNLRTTLDSIGDAVIATDYEGRITRMNPVAEILTGWKFIEAEGKSLEEIFNIVHAKTRDKAENPVTKILESGKVVGLANHTVLISRDGTEYQIADSGAPIADAEGNIYGVVMVFRDVTEEYQNRERIAESENRFRTLHESSLDGVFLLKGSIFVDCNEKAQEMFKLSKSEIVGQHPALLSPPKQFDGRDSYEGAQRIIDEAYEKGSSSFEWLHQRSDGEVFLCEIRLKRVELLDGPHLMVIVRDISERKRAEDALKASENRLREFFQKSPLGYQSLDADGNFIEVNPMWLSILGFERDEVVGKWFGDFLAPGNRDLFKERFPRFKDNGEIQTMFEMIRKDGERITVEFDGRIGYDDRGDFIQTHCVLNDITARRKAEEEKELLAQQVEESHDRLAMLSRKLIESQELDRRRIARELHDEIGQLLTAMKINLQFLQKDSGHPLNQDSMAQRLTDQLGLIDTAIQQIRAISLDLRPSMLDDLGLVPAIRWFMDQQAQRSGIKTIVEEDSIPEHLDPAIENSCYRVLQEAVNNILKHAEAKQIRVLIQVKSDELHMLIQDDGKGFDVEKARALAAQGKSFGLLGMQERLELIGGRFTIYSKHGKGSEVEASFPLSMPNAENKGRKGKQK
jgi:PAS domain S-box-containing protein